MIKDVTAAAWTKVLKPLACFVYEYGGLRFIIVKFTGKRPNSEQFKEPPSGVLWAIGLYVAAFGLSSQQYKSAIENARLRAATYDASEYAHENEYCAAMHKYVAIVPDVPVKPSLYDPISILQSLFGDDVPAMDSTLAEARELEAWAWRTLNASSLFTKARENPEAWEEIAPGEDPNAPHIFRLDQPYTEVRAFIDWNQRGFVTRRAAMPEPFVIDDVHALWRACGEALRNDYDLGRTDKFRHDCAYVVLSRACEETRARLEKTGDKIPLNAAEE